MHKAQVREGYKFQDLWNQGCELTIEHAENGSEEEEEFYDERFDQLKEYHKESSIKTSELNMSFEELKPNMTSITDYNGFVKKQVLKQGVGIVIPEKSVVIMHYDAFTDNQKEPFDSTRKRNRPHKVLIGDGNLLYGFELGIQTMKKEEVSRILVSPEYAYGPMGCPPRIPPEAEILYVVEIIHFFESKDAIEFENMTADEQKKAPFEKVVAVFRCEHQMANDLFRNHHYKPAIARYKKMVRLLEDVSVSDEEQDNQRNRYLLKLYLNLCQSYIQTRNSQKAIIYGKLGFNMDEDNPKAMYRLGCAHLLADEFDKAKQFLLRAKRHLPFDSSIQKALIQVEQKRKEHEQWEKGFCKRIFSNETTEMPATVYSDEEQQFRNILKEQFEKFLEQEEKELSFSSGYLEWQIDVVKDLASEFDLAFVSKIYSDQKIIKVVKKNKTT